MYEPDLIADYLATLRRQLRVSVPVQARILREVEEHLADSVRREEQAGFPPGEAQRRAVSRFGAPELIARQFVAEYATRIACNAGTITCCAIAAALLLLEVRARTIPASASNAGTPPPLDLALSFGIARGGLLLALLIGCLALWRTRSARRAGSILSREAGLAIMHASLAALAVLLASNSADLVYLHLLAARTGTSLAVPFYISLAQTPIILLSGAWIGRARWRLAAPGPYEG